MSNGNQSIYVVGNKMKRTFNQRPCSTRMGVLLIILLLALLLLIMGTSFSPKSFLKTDDDITSSATITTDSTKLRECHPDEKRLHISFTMTKNEWNIVVPPPTSSKHDEETSSFFIQIRPSWESSSSSSSSSSSFTTPIYIEIKHDEYKRLIHDGITVCIPDPDDNICFELMVCGPTNKNQYTIMWGKEEQEIGLMQMNQRSYYSSSTNNENNVLGVSFTQIGHGCTIPTCNDDSENVNEGLLVLQMTNDNVFATPDLYRVKNLAGDTILGIDKGVTLRNSSEYEAPYGFEYRWIIHRQCIPKNDCYHFLSSTTTSYLPHHRQGMDKKYLLPHVSITFDGDEVLDTINYLFVQTSFGDECSATTASKSTNTATIDERQIDSESKSLGKEETCKDDESLFEYYMFYKSPFYKRKVLRWTLLQPVLQQQLENPALLAQGEVEGDSYFNYNKVCIPKDACMDLKIDYDDHRLTPYARMEVLKVDDVTYFQLNNANNREYHRIGNCGMTRDIALLSTMCEGGGGGNLIELEFTLLEPYLEGNNPWWITNNEGNSREDQSFLNENYFMHNRYGPSDFVDGVYFSGETYKSYVCGVPDEACNHRLVLRAGFYNSLSSFKLSFDGEEVEVVTEKMVRGVQPEELYEIPLLHEECKTTKGKISGIVIVSIMGGGVFLAGSLFLVVRDRW